MTAEILPDPATPFGERVRRRLREERVIWFTTTGRDGTPQPNPVWFLWNGGASVVIYNQRDARRLGHLRAHREVALHFDGNGRGGDIVVLTGHAQVLEDEPGPNENPDYVAKYRNDMVRVSGTLDAFGARYPTPVRVEINRVRGH